MASIKNLKKDINYVLGDVIDYALQASSEKKIVQQGEEIIDEAIETFDGLIAKVNAKKIENKKKYFKDVKTELESKANALIEKVNSF